MPTIRDLDEIGGYSGDKTPSFTFARLNDSVTGRIIHANIVETENDRGLQKKVVCNVEVISCKGGLVEKDGQVIVSVDDYNPGDNVAVWLSNKPTIRAFKDALVDANIETLEDAAGGTLTVTLVDRKDIGKPSKINVFDVKFTAPKKSTGSVKVDDLV